MLAKQIVDIVLSFSSMSYNAPNDPLLRAKIYQYLNLYHLDLFSDTASLNTNIHHTIHYTAPYNQNWGKGVRIYDNQGIFNVVDVITPHNGNALLKTTYKSALAKYSNQQSGAKSDPVEYSFSSVPKEDRGGKYFEVFLFPGPATVDVNVTYIKNPEELNDSSVEEVVCVPAAFHQLLVDGTLWYVFQDDAGVRDTVKSLEAKERERIKRIALKDFLFNTSFDSNVRLRQI